LLATAQTEADKKEDEQPHTATLRRNKEKKRAKKDLIQKISLDHLLPGFERCRAAAAALGAKLTVPPPNASHTMVVRLWVVGCFLRGFADPSF